MGKQKDRKRNIGEGVSVRNKQPELKISVLINTDVEFGRVKTGNRWN